MKTLEQLGISPSPWEIDNWSERWLIVRDEKRRYVATPDGDEETEVISNASLIAAAPKLYAACYEMLRYYYEQNTNTTVFNTALELMKQAVAEAAGESEVNDDA